MLTPPCAARPRREGRGVGGGRDESKTHPCNLSVQYVFTAKQFLEQVSVECHSAVKEKKYTHVECHSAVKKKKYTHT